MTDDNDIKSMKEMVEDYMNNVEYRDKVRLKINEIRREIEDHDCVNFTEVDSWSEGYARLWIDISVERDNAECSKCIYYEECKKIVDPDEEMIAEGCPKYQVVE